MDPHSRRAPVQPVATRNGRISSGLPSMSPGITADNPVLQPPNQPAQSTTLGTPPGYPPVQGQAPPPPVPPAQPPQAPPPVAPARPPQAAPQPVQPAAQPVPPAAQPVQAAPRPVQPAAQPGIAPPQAPATPQPQRPPQAPPPATPGQGPNAAGPAPAKAPRKKKGKLLKILAGVGCLAVLGVGLLGVVGAVGVWWYLGSENGADLETLVGDWSLPEGLAVPEGLQAPGGGPAVAPAEPVVPGDAPAAAATDDAAGAASDDGADGTADAAPVDAAPVEPPPPAEPAVVADEAADDAEASAGRRDSRPGGDEPLDAPAPAVTVEHSATTMSVVGDQLTLQATTPGHDDCTVQLKVRPTGGSWKTLTMSRSGSRHTQILPVDSSFAPSFEYYLVASDCGAGLWPADGSRQTVKVF